MGRKMKPVTWVDKGGKVIDAVRIMKHDKSIAGMIKKIFPAWACFEASMSKYDLVSECRLEVAKALCNFDPITAIEGVTKFEDRKTKSDQEHLEWKRANVEKALEKAEALWVRKRLLNYLRRLRWKNTVAEKGGKSVSFSAILAKAEANSVLNFDGTQRSLFGIEETETPDYHHGATLFSEESPMSENIINLDQAQSDRDELLEILSKEGDIAFRKKLMQIESTDPERYDSLISFLQNKSKEISSGVTVSDDDEEDSVESMEEGEEYDKTGTGTDF